MVHRRVRRVIALAQQEPVLLFLYLSTHTIVPLLNESVFDSLFSLITYLSYYSATILVVARYGDVREAHLVGPSVHDLFDGSWQHDVFQIGLGLNCCP